MSDQIMNMPSVNENDPTEHLFVERNTLSNIDELSVGRFITCCLFCCVVGGIILVYIFLALKALSMDDTDAFRMYPE